MERRKSYNGFENASRSSGIRQVDLNPKGKSHVSPGPSWKWHLRENYVLQRYEKIVDGRDRCKKVIQDISREETSPGGV